MWMCAPQPPNVVSVGIQYISCHLIQEHKQVCFEVFQRFSLVFLPPETSLNSLIRQKDDPILTSLSVVFFSVMVIKTFCVNLFNCQQSFRGKKTQSNR